MNKETFLSLVQIFTAVVLVVSVLFQGGGAGLSGPLSGGESFRTRRGVEKVLLFTTVASALILIFAIFANLLI